MKNYDVLNELVPKTQELHREIFDKGYEQGKADALNQQPCEKVATAFQFGMALGFGEKHDEMDRIIKAVIPEQQTCDDCIRRQAVLDTLDKMDKALDDDRTVENYKALLTECYKVLPSVTPKEKTGWIPVNERLPEEDGEYFVTVLDYYSGRPFVDLSHYFIGNVHNNGFYKAHKVIAWIPLPEPYKGVSE